MRHSLTKQIRYWFLCNIKIIFTFIFVQGFLYILEIPHILINDVHFTLVQQVVSSLYPHILIVSQVVKISSNIMELIGPRNIFTTLPIDIGIEFQTFLTVFTELICCSCSNHFTRNKSPVKQPQFIRNIIDWSTILQQTDYHHQVIHCYALCNYQQGLQSIF